MMTFKKGCAVAALALALPLAAMSSGNAAPLAPASVLATSAAGTNNSNPLLTEVQWRRYGYRGYGYRRGWGGAGVGVGLAAGALIGGAIAAGAANPYYGPGYYGPGYYSEPVVVQPGYAGGDAVSYCMQRFKSYDPGSGTYLGYDGLRHPCP
ncbi:BA14K family protein [Bradyrhizobium sp. SYSU BS000235]|uniref:BA14K family protein n=1 Tax=Bradyrhizobium sp. SYSU BS000235 TaxID=3411332 RepID=UPI003C796C66